MLEHVVEHLASFLHDPHEVISNHHHHSASSTSFSTIDVHRPTSFVHAHHQAKVTAFGVFDYFNASFEPYHIPWEPQYNQPYYDRHWHYHDSANGPSGHSPDFYPLNVYKSVNVSARDQCQTMLWDPDKCSDPTDASCKPDAPTVYEQACRFALKNDGGGADETVKTFTMSSPYTPDKVDGADPEKTPKPEWQWDPCTGLSCIFNRTGHWYWPPHSHRMLMTVCAKHTDKPAAGSADEAISKMGPNAMYTSGVVHTTHSNSGLGSCDYYYGQNFHPEITCFEKVGMRDCYGRCLAMGHKCAFVTYELEHDNGRQGEIPANAWDADKVHSSSNLFITCNILVVKFVF